MSKTETSGHYKHTYKSASTLNYSVHPNPKEMESERERGRGGRWGKRYGVGQQGRRIIVRGWRSEEKECCKGEEKMKGDGEGGRRGHIGFLSTAG